MGASVIQKQSFQRQNQKGMHEYLYITVEEKRAH